MKPLRPIRMRYIAILILALTSCSPRAPLSGEVDSRSVHEAYALLSSNTVIPGQDFIDSLESEWHINQVAMILETMRFSKNREVIAMLGNLLKNKTGQEFGYELSDWQNWLWEQEYEPLPTYANFKSSLYSRIDPKFANYFDGQPKAGIRLDEIRWGGVRQDGIPPLRQPKMISAEAASYLGDDDVVFGIEVDGEARAYPKRILAWHEMFVDTIQGVELAGVY